MVTTPLIEPSKVPHNTLHTGQKMPMVGVGFWKSAQTEEVRIPHTHCCLTQSDDYVEAV